MATQIKRYLPRGGSKILAGGSGMKTPPKAMRVWGRSLQPLEARGFGSGFPRS